MKKRMIFIIEIFQPNCCDVTWRNHEWRIDGWARKKNILPCHADGSRVCGLEYDSDMIWKAQCWNFPERLTNFFNTVIAEKWSPADLQRSTTVSIWKGLGSLANCSNPPSIRLLSHTINQTDLWRVSDPLKATSFVSFQLGGLCIELRYHRCHPCWSPPERETSLKTLQHRFV